MLGSTDAAQALLKAMCIRIVCPNALADGSILRPQALQLHSSPTYVVATYELG
ncbi:hypothetical protein WOLCODRAFT_140080 [Wolfiporia cocos MD-104 SS10]|uniref:Uncharacterized protein n=1 Tax=Wolfiporia cocos (strain MD-104) TaxID=742152 RepID=A0A2H3JDP1_WOLCO|nr:hypothetical protein WOLCODRAFT_140080 [Wolfiporia cocos MD-104 SS10]